MMKKGFIPTPVGVIVTRSMTGAINAAPVTWFSPISYKPPMLAVALKLHKHSIKNLRRDGACFTLQLMSFVDRQAVHNMAADIPADVSEADVVGLELEYSEAGFSIPHLKDARQWFECSVTDIYEVPESETHALVIGTIIGDYTPDNYEDILLYYGGTGYGKTGKCEEVEPY